MVALSSFLVVFLLLLWLPPIVNTYELTELSRKDCKGECDHHETWRDYETCIKDCNNDPLDDDIHPMPLTRTTTVYPKVPTNIRVNLSVEVERQTKFIRANVIWDASPDNRKGFYLSFVAKDDVCEKKFPGFYTQNIPPSSRSWVIPVETLAYQPLILDNGCTYRIEMRSIPYPYGDSKYTTIYLLTIPECTGGICDCRRQEVVGVPRNVEIETFWDEKLRNYSARISWTFRFPSDLKDIFTFHLKLADLFKVLKFAQNRKLYKWRPNEFSLPASRSTQKFSVVIPHVGNETELKLEIFAINQHYCRSESVFKIFNATDIPDASNPQRISKLPPTTTTVTIRPQLKTSPSAKTTLKVPANTSSLPTTVELIVSPMVQTSTHHSAQISSIPTLKRLNEDYLVIFLPIICFLCLIIGVFGLVRCYTVRKDSIRKKKQYLNRIKDKPWTLVGSNVFSNPTMMTNILYTEKEIVDARDRGMADNFEIFYERLKMGRVIGQGAFGLVYVGTADSINGVVGPTTVAIKQLKTNADERERQEFLAEIDIMKKVGNHPNIVSMLGCCTLLYPHCSIMEYVPYGDLLQYLRNLRKEYERKSQQFRISFPRSSSDGVVKLRTVSGVSNVTVHTGYGINVNDDSDDFHCQCGMCESQSIADIPFADADGTTPICDLMAPELTYSLNPNELQSFALQVANGMSHLETLQITHRDLAARNILVGHDKVLKISDFGLSRVGVYVKTTSGRIPLRWLSIEAMRDHIYTVKSDCWAYGVVLWEICTLGAFPYPSVSDKDLLRYLESGRRLEKPDSCRKEM